MTKLFKVAAIVVVGMGPFASTNAQAVPFLDGLHDAPSVVAAPAERGPYADGYSALKGASYGAQGLAYLLVGYLPLTR